MAITVRVTTADGVRSELLAAGGALAVDPTARVQILLDGEVIEPSRLVRDFDPPDLSLTLPDGSRITLTGFVDLDGGAGGGLASGAGDVVVASNLDALAAPAAGAAGPDGGNGAGEDGNLSTFNQATLTDFAEFGGGGGSGGGLGPDVASPPLDLPEDSDPFALIAGLSEDLPVDELPAPVTATMTTTPAMVLVEAVTAVAPETTDEPDDDTTTTTPPPPAVPEAVDDLATGDENAILLTPLTINLLDNDTGPTTLAQILPAGVGFTAPANTMVTNEVDNPLGPGELINKDVTLAQDISTMFFTFFDDIGVFNLTVLEDGSATVTVISGNPFGAMGTGDSFEIAFGYEADDGSGGSLSAGALLSITGINESPVARAVNLVGYENEFNFGFPVLSISLPVTDEETILENLPVVLNGQGTIPAEAGISINMPFGFPPDSLNFQPVAIDNSALLSGSSTYSVTDSEGVVVTAGLTVTLRGNGILGELVGSDDPNVHDILIDNADFLTTRSSVLRGLGGDDNLFGENGSDTLFGGDGADIVSGGSESDTAFGDDGNDFVNGDGGDDSLYGGAGDDQLFGGDGGDSLFGGSGSDTLFGGDFFDFGTFMDVDTPDVFAGGPGDDSITVSNTAGAVDRVLWLAGDADGSIDRVSGFDNDGADQDLLDLGAVLTGLGGVGGALSDFLTVSNDGVTTTILVDADGLVGGANVDLTIVLTDIGNGTLANLTDNLVV